MNPPPMEEIVITAVLIFIVAILSFYKYLKTAYGFWEDRGVPYLKPNLLFGNFANLIFRRATLPVEHLNFYRRLSPHPYGGLYASLLKPTLLIRHPELIKRILTKDFDYFQDRGINFDPEVDPLSEHLFGLKGGRDWKIMRAKLVGTFTTSKMKLMFPLMEECALNLTSALSTNVFEEEGDPSSSDDSSSSSGDHSSSSGDSSTIDIKDALARYTTDVIGSCAFGLDTDAIRNADSPFRKMGDRIFRRRYSLILRVLFPSIPRTLIRLFKMQFVEHDVAEFFTSLVERTVESRRKNNVVRNDFLNLLMTLQDEENEAVEEQSVADDSKEESTNLAMTTEIMTAQCFLFFLAGFDTTANAMSFFFLEVAKHPAIQQKLKEEMETVLRENENQLSYESLKEMKYLDMVVNETMRMYPPATMISRRCVRDYKLPDSELTIPKGMLVFVSPIGVHYDSEYYENPEQFNPDNFTDEQRTKRHQYTYLPFGEGPRICIAERFAMMQMKTAIVHLIRNYEFSLSEKTKLPLEYRNFGVLSAKDGIWLNYRKRLPE